jgi:hypothetical protein
MGKVGTCIASLELKLRIHLCKKEHFMTVTTIRISDTEVQVERTLYTFAQKSDADAFAQCVVNDSIDTCYRSHPPLSARPTVPDEHPDDPNRGSTISPSLGGMP